MDGFPCTANLDEIRAELDVLASRRLLGPLLDYEAMRWAELVAQEEDLLASAGS